MRNLSLFLYSLLFFAIPLISYAGGVNPVMDGLCTDSSAFDINLPAPGTGLITTIVLNIQVLLNSIAQGIFTSVVTDQRFIFYLRGMLTLYFVIYGILFALGIAQPTLHDFVMRMVKVATVALLITPGSWNFFNQYVVVFFNRGTDELINVVTSVTIAGEGYSGNAMMGTGGTFSMPPFYVIDNVIAIATSPRMTASLAATFTTGPYGIVYGIFLTIALGSFVRSLLFALWIYIMSLAMKTMLFGLAPIFISFLLFSQTRHLFDGWVNQVLNASLQPLFLFIFFCFFAMLIQGSLIGIVSVPVCWTQMNESIRGTPFSEHFWRYKRDGQMFRGIFDFKDNFPIDILTLLFFMILADLCGKFNHMVVEIASDIAGAATNMSFPGPRGNVVEQLFEPAERKKHSKQVNERGGVGSAGAAGTKTVSEEEPGSENPLEDLKRFARDPVKEASDKAKAGTGKRPGGPA